MYTRDFEPYKHPLNKHNRSNFNIKYKSKWFTKNDQKDSGIHIKPKINKKKIGIKWKKLLNDYSQNTTLHGLRYAGNNELSIIER